MATQATPRVPDPSFVAILLVTRTRAGQPRLILHYPPDDDLHQPTPSKRTRKTTVTGVRSTGVKHDNHASSESEPPFTSSSSDAGDSSAEDEFDDPARYHKRQASSSSRRSARQTKRRGKAKDDGSGGDAKDSSKVPATPASASASWDSVLGSSAEGLAALLTPRSRKAWHKKKFELVLGGLCFLGCPIFEKDGGGWGNSRKGQNGKGTKKAGSSGERRRENVKREEEETSNDDETDDDDRDEERQDTRDSRNAPHKSTPIHTSNPAPSSATVSTSVDASASLPSQSSSLTSPSTTSSTESLSMFNVVFVFAGSTPSSSIPLEHQQHVRDVWKHLSKPLGRALHLQQRRNDWVWTQTRAIQGLREKGRGNGATYSAAWPTIRAASNLAHALATVFDRISAADIAHISLGPQLDLSLQIPRPFSTPNAPTPMSPQVPGLLVTTYDPLSSDASDMAVENDDPYGIGISPHCALLLLGDADSLATELLSTRSQGSDGQDPFAYFIKQSTPTKSLTQLSKRSRLALPKIQALALHLIRWRRAIPIPPLNPSNTYIVSPNADMRRLPAASKAYAARFSTLPSLETMLATLGKVGKAPQPYGTYIPSTDHKSAYMEILAWLMRGGWVTQLRTFAWVWVSADIKAEVAKKMKLEELDAAATSVAIEEDETMDDTHTYEHDRRKSSGDSALAAPLSPHLKSHLNPPRPPSQAGSTSSGRTAIRIVSRGEASPAAGDGKRRSSASQGKDGRGNRHSSGSASSKIPPSTTEAADEITPTAEAFTPSIVLSPHKANALESRWLEQVGSSLPDEGVKAVWPKLLKHFDGKHAIEEIAVCEGWKRKVVTPLLMKLTGENGVLMTVRHW